MPPIEKSSEKVFWIQTKQFKLSKEKFTKIEQKKWIGKTRSEEKILKVKCFKYGQMGHLSKDCDKVGTEILKRTVNLLEIEDDEEILEISQTEWSCGYRKDDEINPK